MAQRLRRVRGRFRGCLGEGDKMSDEDLKATIDELIRLASDDTIPQVPGSFMETAEQIIALVREADFETRCCDVCGKRIPDAFYEACDDCERAEAELRRG
jgi:hypothetical protein